jgi:hypothetical protein
MKKLLLYSLMAVLLVSGYSCKKNDSDDTPAYYMKFKLAGNWITYKNAISNYGPDLSDPSLTDLVVNGDDGKDVLSLAIQVNGSTIPSGTYDTDNSNYWATIDWTVNGTNGPRVYDVDDAPTMPPSKYILKITSITETEIRGTFTGNYLYDYWANDPDDLTDAMRQITEGEFVAKRIK